VKIIFWGFLWSSILGVPLGILCGVFGVFSKLTEPAIDFVRYMPAPVFGALAVAVLGIYDAPKIAIIFIGTFFQQVLVIANTTRKMDISLIEAAQTLGARKPQILLRVVLPAISVDLYNDMRILLGWAWTYLIVAEYIGASSGITYFINQQAKYRIYDNVDGVPVAGAGPDRGMVFQGYTLFPWLTVKKNVMFGLQMTGKSSFDAESEAREWVALVGLSKFENSYPHELSGGMKQRVAIAWALANRPRILLMDEPFGALDAQTRAQMQHYLLEIWKNIDVTILFITHDLDEAVYLSDRILVLGANPSRVLEVIENPVPRPRAREQFVAPEFLATYRRISELIHPEEKIRDEEKIHIPRLTTIGDDVE